MKFSAWFCLFAAMALAACETVQTTQGGVVGVERRQSMSSLIPASQIDRSAVQAYGQVISEAGKKNQLNRDSAQVERVRGGANRLIPSTVAFPHPRAQGAGADRIGVGVAARPGYEPRAAVSLWQKMGKHGGSRTPEGISPNPSGKSRTRALQTCTGRDLPLYEAAGRR